EQVHPPRACRQRGLDHGALLHVGDPRWRAHHEPRMCEAALVHPADEVAQHLLRHLEVSDHPMAQRPDRRDRGRRAPDHALGFAADRVDRTGVCVHRHNRRLRHHAPAIARTVCESLGFATVVITIYRPAWNDFEVTAVHGSEEARGVLQGTVREWEDLAPLMDERFLRRGAYFIPHNEFDWNSIDGASFVPNIELRDDPDAWHPEDALLVPLVRADGSTLGLISVDEPASGRTPTDAELDVLVAVAAHAALAVGTAQEGEGASHYRESLEQLLLA